MFDNSCFRYFGCDFALASRREHRGAGHARPGAADPQPRLWIDFLFLWVLMDRDWKCVVSSVAARYSWVHRLIMINRRTFPIDPASPYAVKRMAEHLREGGRLVLFAEGQLTRTGSLMKLFDGTGFLLHKTRAKVVTCYLRGRQPAAVVASAGLAALVARDHGALQPRARRPGLRRDEHHPGPRPAHHLAA